MCSKYKAHDNQGSSLVTLEVGQSATSHQISWSNYRQCLRVPPTPIILQETKWTEEINSGRVRDTRSGKGDADEE